MFALLGGGFAGAVAYIHACVRLTGADNAVIREP